MVKATSPLWNRLDMNDAADRSSVSPSYGDAIWTMTAPSSQSRESEMKEVHEFFTSSVWK